VATPALTVIRGAEIERIAYLTQTQEARLSASYSGSAAPVMIVLCETGLRTQEALRLDWRHVDCDTTTVITIATDTEAGIGESSNRCGPARIMKSGSRAIHWVSRMYFI
jgi:integrase